MVQYRDDRMYVLRLSADFETSTIGTMTKTIGTMTIRGKEFNLKSRDQEVALITYRNTLQLPAVRTDQFPDMDAAVNYIRKIEPTCPRVRLGGKSPDPTPTWEAHLDWLHKNGLKSVLEGDNPIPDWAK